VPELTIKYPSRLLGVERREITEEQADKVRELLAEPEWCLHCGTDTCEHAAQHNAALGKEA